jgi:hypothetical protein
MNLALTSKKMEVLRKFAGLPDFSPPMGGWLESAESI